MPASERLLQPRTEARMAFNLLMELYDKGRTLNTEAKVDAIDKFLAVSQPGIEKRIKWGWFLKADRAERIVTALRWGLDQFRKGEPFMRSGPPEGLLEGLALFPFPAEIEQFQDGIVWDRSRGQAVRVASRDPRHLFLTRVFELLTEVAPWLRVCQREDCQRFFLFLRPKQIYCSDVCAQHVRMARYLARRAPAPSGQRGTRRK